MSAVGLLVLAGPSRIAARRSDLYGALTRATERLGILHAGEPTAVPARLRPVSSVADIS
jgi:hypothetical protein